MNECHSVHSPRTMAFFFSFLSLQPCIPLVHVLVKLCMVAHWHFFTLPLTGHTFVSTTSPCLNWWHHSALAYDALSTLEKSEVDRFPCQVIPLYRRLYITTAVPVTNLPPHLQGVISGRQRSNKFAVASAVSSRVPVHVVRSRSPNSHSIVHRTYCFFYCNGAGSIGKCVNVNCNVHLVQIAEFHYYCICFWRYSFE